MGDHTREEKPDRPVRMTTQDPVPMTMQDPVRMMIREDDPDWKFGQRQVRIAVQQSSADEEHRHRNPGRRPAPAPPPPSMPEAPRKPTPEKKD